VLWLCLMLYLIFLGEAAGFTRFGGHPAVYLTLTALFVLGLSGSIWSIKRSSATPPFHLPGSIWTLISLAPALAVNPPILIALNWVFQRFGYNLQWGPFAAYVGFTLIFAFGIAGSLASDAKSRRTSARRRPMTLLLVALALAITGQWVAIASFPLHPARSDMLAAIDAAVRRWLDGAGLYGTLQLPTHTIPNPYLPLMEIPYAPLVRLGADLRWLGVLGLVLVALLAYAASRRPSHGLATTVAAFVLSPLLVARHDLYLSPLWVALAVFGASVVRERWRLASMAVGLSLAVQQTCLLLLPFYALLLWRKHGLRTALLHTCFVLAIAALALAPFVAASPGDFVYGVLGRYGAAVARSGPLGMVATFTGGGFSLAALTYPLLGSTLALMVQLTAYACVVLIAAARLRDGMDCLLYAAIGLASFFLFNKPPWNWAYFYTSVFILLLFAAIALDEAAWLAQPAPGRQSADRVCTVPDATAAGGCIVPADSIATMNRLRAV
jgi:hypothetical protein